MRTRTMPAGLKTGACCPVYGTLETWSKIGASIRTQLEWCRKEGVRRAIFSHCGSGIVNGDPEAVAAKVRLLGLDGGVDATVAHDGLSIAL